MFTFEILRLNGQKLMNSSTRQEVVLFNLNNVEGMLQIGQMMITIYTHYSYFNHIDFILSNSGWHCCF